MTLKRVLLVFGVVLALTAVHAAAVTVIVDGRSVGNLQTFTFENGVLRVTTTGETTDPEQPDPDTFGLQVIRNGSGTVTSEPQGINCGSTCTSNFNQGQRVTLTAQPQSGWRFASWSGACVSNQPTCTVTMSQAHTVTATFTQETAGNGCPDFPNTTEFDTPLMQQNFNRTGVLRPAPNDVYAFKISVPSDNVNVGFSAVATSASPAAKLLSVSQCPGDAMRQVTDGIRGACWNISAEVTDLTLTTNQSADPRFWCILQPGRDYYINASSNAGIDTTTKTCTTPDRCSFTARGFRF